MDEQRIIQRYHELRSCRAVAEEIGCSLETIRRVLKRNNVDRTGWKQTKEYRLPVKKYPQKSRAYEPVSYDKECAYCGGRFIAHRKNKIYCSKKCKDIANKLKHGISCNSSTKPCVKTCSVCGATFETFREEQKTCSHKCSLIRKGRIGTGKRERKTVSETIAERLGERYEYVGHDSSKIRLKCKTCGNVIERTHATVYRRSVQCEYCKEAEDLKKARQQMMCFFIALKDSKTPKKCAACGKEFTSNYPTQKYCSSKCKKSGSSYRSRCRHYGVYYDPSVTRIKVIQRDKNTCQICGKTCDPKDTSWGSSGPDFPTLDHIIPLAKGGAHTWDNVQCACGICNSNKRDLIGCYINGRVS